MDTLATKAELNCVCDYLCKEPDIGSVVIDDETKVVAAASRKEVILTAAITATAVEASQQKPLWKTILLE